MTPAETDSGRPGTVACTTSRGASTRPTSTRRPSPSSSGRSRFLPWPVFAALWTAASIGCLFWMRVPWMLAFPGVIDDILRGNIHVFLAAMVVVGFRYSPAPTPSGSSPRSRPASASSGSPSGASGARWDWGWASRGLIVGVSFALSPELWFEWFELLRRRRRTMSRASRSCRCRCWFDSRSPWAHRLRGPHEQSLAGAHRRHAGAAERVDLVDRAAGGGPGAVGMAADTPARGPCRLPRWSSGRLTPR